MQLQGFLSRLMWAGMAPLLGLALVLLGLRLYQLESRLEHNGGDLLMEAARDVGADLALRRAALEVLAASPLLDEAQPTPALYRQLQAFAQRFGGNVLVVGPAQEVLMHTAIALGSPLPPLPRPRRHSAVAAVQAGKGPAVGDVFQGPVVGRPLVALAVPVERAGQARRVLLATLEASQLQAVLDHLALPAGWSLLLRDGAQQLIAHRGEEPDPDVDPESPQEPPPAARRLTHRLEAAPWSLSLTISPSARLGPLLQGGGLLLAGGLLAWSMAYAGSRSAALRLAQGLEAMAAPRPPGPAHAAGVGAATDRAPREAVAQAQKALELNAARTQAIVEHAGDVILTYDEDFTITSANPAALRLWGEAGGELVGSRVERWIPQRHHARLQAWAQHFKAHAGEPETVGRRALMKLLTADGRERVMEAQTSAVQAGGQVFYVAVLRDMSELVQARQALEEKASHLRRLVDRMHTVQEEERSRISRDLHDDLQQRLALADLGLATLQQAAEAGQPVDAAQVQHARAALRETIAATRRIVRDLLPPALEELGLAAALEQMVRPLGTTLEGGCELDVQGEREPPPEVALCLYRVAQESLNNVRKHANAHSAWVRLDLASPDRITLEVEDDGVGPSAGAPPQAGEPAAADATALHRAGDGLSGLGLLGMAERLRAVGGTLEVSRGPAGGTLLRARVPRAQESTSAVGVPHSKIEG